MKRVYFILFLFSLVFLILFVGCIKKPVPPVEFYNIKGIVHTDGENEGILHFHYNNGDMFGQTSVCERGGFLIERDETFADDFVAYADIIYDDLECRYSAEIKSLESNQPIYIGPVSTLIFNYHLINPEYTYSKCRKDVLEFLNIDPTLSDLTIFIRKSVFSNEKFMEYAKGFGSFDKFINFLMDQIIGGTTHYEFKELEGFPTKDYLEQAIGDLAENLDIPGGGCITGWIIDTIGGGGPPDPLKPIEELLKAQTIMLEQIISMVQDLENEIQDLENEMEKLLAETNYDILVGQLNEPIGKIKSYYETLHTYSTLEATTTNKDEMEDFRRAIVKDVQPAYEQIYLTLNGSAGAESLLSIWSRVAFVNSVDIEDYVERIKSQLTYYIGYLIKAIDLTVEGYHEYDPPDIHMARSKYYSNLGEIQDLLDQYDDYNPITTIGATATFEATTTFDDGVSNIFLGEKYLYAMINSFCHEIDVIDPIDLTVEHKIIFENYEEMVYQIAEDSGLLYFYVGNPDQGSTLNRLPSIVHFCNNDTFSPIYHWEMNDPDTPYMFEFHGELRVEDPWVCVLQSMQQDPNSNLFDYTHYLNIIPFGQVEPNYARIDIGLFNITADFEIQDGYAYVLGQGGTLKSIDLSNNTIVDTIIIPNGKHDECSGGEQRDIFLNGDKAWATIYTTSGLSELIQLDISDPTNIKMESFMRVPDVVEEILVDKYFCYMICSKDNSSYCDVLYRNPFSSSTHSLRFSELDGLGYFYLGSGLQMDDGKNLYTFKENKITRLEKYLPFEILPQ